MTNPYAPRDNGPDDESNTHGKDWSPQNPTNSPAGTPPPGEPYGGYPTEGSTGGTVPPMGGGYPASGPVGGGYPAGNPMNGGYPPSGQGYPTANNGYQPTGSGYPPAGGNSGMPSPSYPVASPYADVGTRFGALIIDYLVMGVIMGVIGGALLWNDFKNWFDAVDQWDGYGATPELPMGGIYLVSFLGVLVWFIYRVGMEIARGQTLGKMALKIKVVDVDGRNPTVGASLVRNSWYVIGAFVNFIPFIGWFLWLGIFVAMAVTIGTQTYRQSFTDRWAKTYVVRA